MNQIKTETAYRVEYYNPQLKQWRVVDTYSQQLNAFNAFLIYKSENYTCRMSKLESKIEIMEQYRRKSRKEE